MTLEPSWLENKNYHFAVNVITNTRLVHSRISLQHLNQLYRKLAGFRQSLQPS